MSWDDVLAGRPARLQRPPLTAVVVASQEPGVFVTPVGEDVRHPIGPCLGGHWLKPGSQVLVVFTDEGPWIAAWDSQRLEQLVKDLQQRVTALEGSS